MPSSTLSNSPTPVELRRQAVQRVRATLLRRAHPRLQMSALLAVTGGVGFGVAYTLLYLGVASMAVRYPAAVLVAYAAFLLELRLWVRLLARHRAEHQRRHGSFDLGVGFDLGGGGGGGGSGGGAPGFGGGGGFSGGGAGGSWAGGEPMPVVLPVQASNSAASFAPRASGGSGASGGKGGGSGFSLDLGDDAGLALILVGVILVAVSGVAIYLIALAPTLLAEMLVDGAVVTGLYPHLRRVAQGGSVRAAIRRTWLAALAVTVLVTGCGYEIQRLLPGARSIGDVWRIHVARQAAHPSSSSPVQP